MTAQATTRRKAPRLAAAVLAACALLALAGYLGRPRVEIWARARILAELEKATGGRAEAGTVTWSVRRGEIQLQDLTVHGLEPAGAPPYLHADRIFVRLKLMNVFGAKWGIRDLDIDHPAVHLLTLADGTTNLPPPRLRGREAQVQTLFAMEVGRVEARDGELWVNDRRTPFDFSANDVQFQMDYAARARRYDGTLALGRLETSYKDLRPFASRARIEFSLAPGKLDLKSVAWASGHSRLQAAGSVTDFDHPRTEFRYDGTLDLEQWAAMVRLSPVRAGMLEVHGSGAFQDGGFASAGKLLLRDGIYETPEARLAATSASGDYQFDQRRLALTGLVVRALGGTAEGQAEIANWTQPAAPDGQAGTATLRLRGLSLAQLLAASPPARRRLGGMNLVGSASGELALAWRGSLRDAEAKVALQIVAPSQDPPPQVPVSGTINLSYNGARGAQISDLDLTAQSGTRLRARGTLGDRGSLQVSFTTGDLSQFQPLLTALTLGEQAPTDLRGRASFTGTMSGKLSAPAIAGHLELTDFDAMAAPLRGTNAVRHPLHLDRFVADVEYSPFVLAARHGLLRSSSVQMQFDVRAGLQRGSFTAASPLEARVTVQRAALADVQRLAGADYPISGIAALAWSVSGTRDNLRGGGPLRIADGSLYGQPFKSLAARLQLEGGEVRLEQLRLTQDGGSVQGAIAYRPANDALRFDLAGTDFALADVPQLQWSRLKIAGAASFHAKGEGTAAQPVITFQLALRNLALNNQRAGDFDLEGVTRGAELQLTGSSRPGEPRIAVRGGIHLGGDYTGSINLRLSQLDVNPLIEAVSPAQPTGPSALSGAIDISGPLRRPRDLTARGDLEQFRVHLENVELRNQDPIRFSYAGRVARLEELHLVGEDTDLKADGTVSLTGDRPLDMHADGRMNLKLLESMNPALVASGRAAMAVSVSGTVAQPSVRGQVYIRDAALSYVDLPNGLTNVNGTLVFNQNRLAVQTLRAQSGGGTLDLGGFIAYEHGVYFNLTATGKEIRIRYPAGVSAQADSTLRYAGTLAGSLLSGDVVVNRFNVTPQFDLALYLARSAKPAVAPSLSPVLNNLKFDVHITTAPELEVQTSGGFKVTGDADLRVRGTASRPVLLGRIDITQGEVKFNNTNYQLDRGDITFTNPTVIEPIFNIDATTRVRDYDITLGFHGTPDHMRKVFRSDPPMPEGDIIALLAMGRTREESTSLTGQATSPFTEAASNAILGAAISNVLSSRAQKLFGLSQIKIDPSVGGPENNPNARLTIEQQVSGRVTLTYVTNLAQSAQQVIQAEFQINRNLSIIAVRDQYGVVGFDVRYRHRKK